MRNCITAAGVPAKSASTDFLGAQTDPDQPRYAVIGGKHEIQDILEICSAFSLSIVAHHEPGQKRRHHAEIRPSNSALRSYAKDAGQSTPEPARAVPSVGPKEFAQVLQSPNITLIVAAVTVSDQEDSFLETSRYAREQLGFGGRILHLAALCDLYQFPPHRLLLTGVASSGNMIFQNILFDLLEHSTKPNPLTDVRLAGRAASFAVNHLVSVRRLFSEYLHDGSLEAITASSTHMGIGQCLIQTDDQYCALAGFPLRSYAWGTQWAATHEPITEHTVDFYEANGYSILYILRHPLDVIISNAAKTSSVLPGERRPELALENLEWFEDFVKVMCGYMRGLASQKDRLAFVRYESLLTDPTSEIDKLAAAFDIRVPDGLQSEIWAKLDGVPVAGREHFWAPGTEKWKSRLHHGHRDIVMSTELPALCAELGYSLSADDFNGRRQDTPDLPPDVKLALPKMAWIDAVLEIPIGKPATLAGDIVRVENADGLVGFFDHAHEQRGRALMASAELKALVESAYMTGHPPVATTVREFLATS